jgi:2-keto-4-pentenoate hydratase/2-oxohepta-3-ene-1,7-dioic acid hydratase in catechol pathway
MRLVRFAPAGGGAPCFALVEGDRAVECSDPFAGSGAPPVPTGPEHDLASLRLLPPSAPSKIVCASGTYRAVILEMKKAWPTEPVVFLKPSTALIGHGDAIRWPAGVGELTHEPELAVVISKRATAVAPAEIDSHILGYTCANDVSAWDVLQRVTHFTRPKGYDTFCPVGPVVVKGEGFDPDDAGIRSWVNGERVLDTRTSDMVFPLRELVSFCSHVMTLLPGDVISTGACGVGQLAAGDLVEIEIDGIGRLGNRVERA